MSAGKLISISICYFCWRAQSLGASREPTFCPESLAPKLPLENQEIVILIRWSSAIFRLAIGAGEIDFNDVSS
jgi:hypothetical protein